MLAVGPLFTLLTTSAPARAYPAQMKAVLLRAHPDARLVDVSHDVPPYDVLAGALLLEACAPWFDESAVHLAVVDPGVGTARRALCVVDPEGRRFVGRTGSSRPSSARGRARSDRARRQSRRRAARPSTAATSSRPPPPSAGGGAPSARTAGGRSGAARLA